MCAFLAARAERQALRVVEVEKTYTLHHYIFQDVYHFAGEPHVTDLYKPAEPGQRLHRFTGVEELEGKAKRIFARLERGNELKNLDRETFAKRAATLFSDLNQLHPFREGNGRTQRAFVGALAREAGFDLNLQLATFNLQPKRNNSLSASRAVTLLPLWRNSR